MGKFTSEIDICNDAISRVGGKFINSIENPTTHTETLMASKYAKNRRIVLRSAVWNFAQEQRTIPKSSEVINGFAAVYPLPNDFIRFLEISDVGIKPGDSDQFKLIGGKIGLKYESPDTIDLQYIKDVLTVPTYDPLFIEALSLRLSYEIQYALSGKNTTSDRLLQEYMEALTNAKMIDGQEQKPIRVQRSKWLTARRRGTTRQYASTERYFEGY